jgi:hypothetical protein
VTAPSAFVQFDRELWLAKRVGLPHPMELFQGVTTAEERRNRIRVVIQIRGLSDCPCNPRAEAPVTFRQAFERLYGEAL